MQKTFYSLLFLSLSTSLYAEVERVEHIAKPNLTLNKPLGQEHSQTNDAPITLAELKQDKVTTEKLLNYVIKNRRYDLVEILLPIYNRFSDKNMTLSQYAEGILAYSQQNYPLAIEKYRSILSQRPHLNPVRFELAKSLFFDQQNELAKIQLQKVKSEANLPKSLILNIDAYLQAIEERNRWQSDFSVYYIRDKNVNNTSKSREIESSGFRKNDDMMPQSAQGLAYHFNLEKDFNLNQSHYLHFENNLNGKWYWNNKDYNDIYNRTYLGYRHKKALATFSFLPFYERRWYGNKRYQWANGIRAEYQKWLTSQFQISTAGEYAKNRYLTNEKLNGSTKLASMTLFWRQNPQQAFYLGSDFVRETAQIKQYSSDTKTVRVGWIREWGKGISTRLAGSFSSRQYKDKAIFGGIIPLNKVRQDKIYTANLTLWKRDWHWLGITPKLQFSWKNQKSNLPTLYAYQEKDVRLVFEKSF